MKLMINGCSRSRSDFLDAGRGESLAQRDAIGLTLLAIAIGAVATLPLVCIYCHRGTTTVYGIHALHRQQHRQYKRKINEKMARHWHSDTPIFAILKSMVTG